MVPVEGTITVGGKPPAESGYVYFLPHDSGAAAGNHATNAVRPGSGSFGPDGRYVVTSIRPNDGLTPGTYAVRLEFWGNDRGHESFTDSRSRPTVFNAPAVRVNADSSRPFRHDIDAGE